MKVLLLLLTLACTLVAAVDLSTEIPEIRTKDGRVLRQVRIIGYGASAITAKWDGGRGAIAYADLPADLAAAVEPIRASQKAASDASAAKQRKDQAAARAKAEAAKQAAAEEAKRTYEITGSVFIATRGGENVKLGDLEVYAVDPLAWAAYDAQRDNMRMGSVRTAKDNYKQASYTLHGYTMGERWSQVERVFIDTFYPHPEHLAKATTDADGKFVIKSPQKTVILFAVGSRSLYRITEYYAWGIEVTAGEPTNLTPSNQLRP